MSPQEKRWWSYAAVTVLVSGVYFVVVLSGAIGRRVEDIEFQAPLLIAGAVGAILGVLSNVVIRATSTITTGGGGTLRDDRDREINQRGEYIGGIALAVAMSVPLLLTLVEAPHFWIANAMYLAFTIWALTSSAVKLLLYRRGF